MPEHEYMQTDVQALGLMALGLGRVNRATYHEDGQRPETVTDHTVMLGLVACAFAARYLPDLDLGKIAQYALVHDLPEVYAGDTPTLHVLSENEKQAKKDREVKAALRIADETTGLPWVIDTMTDYEAQDEGDPEARYVRAIDKLLPKITHVANGYVTITEQGMGYHALSERYAIQHDELMAYVGEVQFEPLFQLREELVECVLDMMWKAGEAS